MKEPFNLQKRITLLEDEIEAMREEWKKASPTMRLLIEDKASPKKQEVLILKRTLAKREREEKQKQLDTGSL